MIFRIPTLLTFFSVALFAVSTPKKSLMAYYDAMNTGNIEKLRQVMTADSFKMTIEVWALSIALNEPGFKKTLNAYMQSPQATQQVDQRVSEKLKNSKKRNVVILTEVPIGKDRVMIRFMENDAPKKLYFSNHTKKWKVDYYAGRKK